MKPNGLGIYMRHKVGTASLLNMARFPFTSIDLKDIPKPSGVWMCVCVCVCVWGGGVTGRYVVDKWVRVCGRMS